ncbi:hypothetical protein PFISCL1PPCAC_26741, partial [Pristionchus fissidentatus]
AAAAAAAVLTTMANQQPTSSAAAAANSTQQRRPVIAANGMEVANVIMLATIRQGDPTQSIPRAAFDALISALNRVGNGEDLIDSVLAKVQQDAPEHMSACMRALQSIVIGHEARNAAPNDPASLLANLQAQSEMFRQSQQAAAQQVAAAQQAAAQLQQQQQQ